MASQGPWLLRLESLPRVGLVDPYRIGVTASRYVRGRDPYVPRRRSAVNFDLELAQALQSPEEPYPLVLVQGMAWLASPAPPSRVQDAPTRTPA